MLIDQRREGDYDLNKLRIAVYKNTCKIHQNSDTIQRMNPMQHFTFDIHRIHEVRRIIVQQSVSISKLTAALTPNLHHGRQDLSNLEARTSADHQSKGSEKCGETRSKEFEETRSGNIEFRIEGLPIHHTKPFKRKTIFAEKQSGD